MKKNLYFYTNLLAWGLVLFLIANYVFAWITPSANPPEANLPAPINVSSDTQTKTGGLNIATGGGNVGIGTTSPGAKLDVAGDIKFTGGNLKTDAISLITPVYIRGTGLNHAANRIVKVGNNTLVNSSGRGLTLTIITASTHELVSSTNYDTYGSATDSDNLATALNNLTRDQIGILTSYDAIEANITSNLRAAARRLGLFKLAGCPGGSRRPYAAIFYGSGTSTGNTEPGRHAIEVLQSNDTDAPFAVIVTWLTEDGFISQDLTNALISGEPNTSDPAVFVNSSGNVGIGTTNPGAKLEVAGQIKITGGSPGAGKVLISDSSGLASWQTASGVPSGIIVMWSGTLATIPSGWALCDGTNGTPDLRDRFIYGTSADEDPGATGGATTHTHVIPGMHIQWYKIWDNQAYNGRPYVSGDYDGTFTTSYAPAGVSSPQTSMNYKYYGTIADRTRSYFQLQNPQTDTQSASSLPPYYKLAFIMKL